VPGIELAGESLRKRRAALIAADTPSNKRSPP
jgi:hypothetical protein